MDLTVNNHNNMFNILGEQMWFYTGMGTKVNIPFLYIYKSLFQCHLGLTFSSAIHFYAYL